MKFGVFALIGLASSIRLNGDDGIIDAVKSDAANCAPRLWISNDEMRYQMDHFSRHFDTASLNNALEIAGKLGVKPPRINTWELNDKAFSFPRVRRYDTVGDNMDKIQHW